MNFQRMPILFLMILIFPPFLFPQDNGTAVEDQMRAPVSNPAAMGVGNSTGLGYRQSFDKEGFIRDFDLIFSMGNMAYSFLGNPGRTEHLFSGGARVSQGLYTGISLGWIHEEGWDTEFGLSLLYRPLSFLSLALKGEDLSGSPYGIVGMGFRPLAFHSGWASRMNLWTDARWDGEGYLTQSAGMSVEPAEGVKFSGFYDFQEDTATLEAAFALGNVEAGGSASGNREESFLQGDVHVYSTFKKQRTLTETGFRKALVYDMAQTIMDSPGGAYRSAFTWNGERSLLDFIQDMEQIKEDRSVKVIIFRNQHFQTSFANLLEIETLLKELKASGKIIYFYYDSLENYPYSLAASVADAIYLNPAGSVNLRGFAATRFYFRDFLENWGIIFQNFQSHPYKTAFNNLSESSMTPQERSTLEGLFRSLQQEQLRMLSGRSGKFTASPSVILNRGPFVYASEALESGMVDGLYYEDEFIKLLEDEKLTILPYSLSANRMEYNWEGSGKPVIAVIYARGSIHGGTGIAGQSIGSDSMAKAIRQARNNPLVKAVVLRIDSGGGSSLASDIIAREVALCNTGKNPKPVVVSMGGTAASGGYYIAAPADYIIASPGSITGSIGVISVFPDFSGFLEKFRIGTGTVKTAEGADSGTPIRPFTGEETDQMHDYIKAIYDRFTRVVVENRPVEQKDMEKLAQGRIWSGSQAAENGLADQTGGLRDAIIYAGKIMGDSENVRILEMVPGRELNFMERAFPWMKAEKNASWELLPEDMRQLLEFYNKIESYPRGEALYLMPYSPSELNFTGFP